MTFWTTIVREAIRSGRRCCMASVLLLFIGIFPAPQAEASCANILRIEGVTYGRSWWNNDGTLGRPLTEADLGPEYSRVEENSASVEEKSRQTGTSGSTSCESTGNYSTDLPIGTPLHEVRGYDPTFRLAARLSDGLIVLFEVSFDPSANTGGEFFDIEDHVVAVGLVTRDGQEVAEIEDAEIVARLVELMTAAPITDTDLQTKQDSSLTVAYNLDDGTVADDNWFSDTGELLSGIQAPDEYSEILRSGLAAAETPVP